MRTNMYTACRRLRLSTSRRRLDSRVIGARSILVLAIRCRIAVRMDDKLAGADDMFAAELVTSESSRFGPIAVVYECVYASPELPSTPFAYRPRMLLA